MPVNFNEPLSMLQRITEDFEYYKILDAAAVAKSTEEQVALVAAFSVSSYASTLIRTTKPFNPLLGETYELDRVEEMGLRLIVEQGMLYSFMTLDLVFIQFHIIHHQQLFMLYLWITEVGNYLVKWQWRPSSGENICL